LEAPSRVHVRTRAPRYLHASAADVDDDHDVAGDTHAVHRCLMDQARFFGAGNDTGANAGLRDDRVQELAAVLGLPGGARRDGDDLVHAVRVGEPPELGEHLKCGVHGLGRQRPTVEPAGSQPDHFLLSIDDFKRQIRTDAHDYHVQRVRADVDGRYPHRRFLTIMGVLPQSALLYHVDVTALRLAEHASRTV